MLLVQDASVPEDSYVVHDELSSFELCNLSTMYYIYRIDTGTVEEFDAVKREWVSVKTLTKQQMLELDK